jgi:microcystin-dependent protein
MEPYIGQIMMFAGNFEPQGWASCDGRLLPIAHHTALFSILGTTYGGDGQRTFALPDLRGRLPMHAGQGGGLSHRNLGDAGGAEMVTLGSHQLPAHGHHAVLTGSVVRAQEGADVEVVGVAPGKASPVGINVHNSGGSQPVSVVPPFLCVNFIIALVGLYPSRS